MGRVAPVFGVLATALLLGVAPGCGTDGGVDAASRFFGSIDEALASICACLPQEQEQECLDALDAALGGGDENCVRQVLREHPDAQPAFDCAAGFAESLNVCVQSAGCELDALDACVSSFFELDLDVECPAIPSEAEDALDLCFDLGDTGDTGDTGIF